MIVDADSDTCSCEAVIKVIVDGFGGFTNIKNSHHTIHVHSQK